MIIVKLWFQRPHTYWLNFSSCIAHCAQVNAWFAFTLQVSVFMSYVGREKRACIYCAWGRSGFSCAVAALHHAQRTAQHITLTPVPKLARWLFSAGIAGNRNDPYWPVPSPVRDTNLSVPVREEMDRTGHSGWYRNWIYSYLAIWLSRIVSRLSRICRGLFG
jgi:hypothetical protein